MRLLSNCHFTDLLGLPEFRPGAMENWGLVIFRHQALAWNPHMDTSFKRAASVISTIVHELAHQVRCSMAINETNATMLAVVRRFGDSGMVG